MKKFLLLSLILGACASAPPPAPEPEPTPPPAPVEPPAPTTPGTLGVTLGGPGLSPNDDTAFETLEIRTSVQNPGVPARWRLSVRSQAADEALQAWEGTGRPPLTQFWDGRKADGSPSGEGRYLARLEVWWGEPEQTAQAESPAFALDLSGPDLGLDLSSPSLAFGPEGLSEPFVFTVRAADGLSTVETWALELFTPSGTPFRRFQSLHHSSGRIDWDGRSDDGDLPAPGQELTWRLSARDSLFNTRRAEGSLPVEGTLGSVAAPEPPARPPVPELEAIYFGSFRRDLSGQSGARAAATAAVLEAAAAWLKADPEARLHLVGHAVQIWHFNAARGRREQAEVLLPLSRARAEAVRAALVARGANPAQITVEGLGGSRPVVPHSRLNERWRNRRVELLPRL